jgi:amino acid adenylation domain-containing protein
MIFLENFFEATAARLPDAIAVDDGGMTISYRELEQRANRIAHHLISIGVEPNSRVCIFTGKNIGAYTAVLGVLKAAACWVPLPAGQPEERLRQLVRVVDPAVIIADVETMAVARAIRGVGGADVSILVLGGNESNAQAAICCESDLVIQSSVKPDIEGRNPDDLAYIIFTSGSTGQPKGVMVQHRNITQFLNVCHDFFGVAQGSRFAHHSDLTFDPSLFDLFYCWSRGGTLVPFNRPSYRINPALFVRDTQVNVWFSVPSAITSIVDGGGLSDPKLSSIKHLVLGGEPIPGHVIQAWYQAFPDTKIYNVYGTTETAIISHWYQIPHDHDPAKPVPVGRPLPGIRIRLMEEDSIVPPGESGECVVYSSQISPGYWANDEETRARYVRDPIDRRMPQRWYRTGDLLRLRPDGLYEYVGRIDNQVKIRGHRVELGEVELVLEGHESVAEAAVIPWKPENKPNEARLVAYVAGRQGANPEALRRYLEDRLPRYMVPMRFVIEHLPLPRNANGKIDRLALSARTGREEGNR